MGTRNIAASSLQHHGTPGTQELGRGAHGLDALQQGPQPYLACVPPPPTTGPAVEGQPSSTRGDSIDGPGARFLRGSGRSGILQHHPAACCMLLQSYFPWLPSPSSISRYQPHLLVPTPARRPSLPWARSLLFATSARRPLAPHRAHGDGLPTDECTHPIGWVIEISNLA
ncbi:hypothetical protein BKA56DRAFT_325653 [Ilyonectria sp. MPI-CAGE-AT-0026]|nr:hypothetical protein BKA56DRAFT_325653 [Ilyonectria sp. MPI-CAGE-AT-0026]